jgi:hypothetical protein
VFCFSLQLFPETFLGLSRIRRDITVMLIGLHVKYPLSTHYSCRILTKLEISRQILETYLNVISYENPSGGSRVASRGRPDGQTDSLHSLFAVLRTRLKTNCSFAWNIFKSIYWSLKCVWNVYLRHVSLEIVALYRSKLMTHHEF